MRKSRGPIVVFFVFLLVYMVVILLIPFARNEVYWCSFAISVLEYCGSGAIVIMAIKSKNDKEKIFDLAKIRSSCIFCLVCIIMNTFVMAYGNVSMWVVLISNLIAIGVYVLVVILFSAQKKYNKNFEEKLHEQTGEIKFFYSKIEKLISKTYSIELRSSLQELLEVLKYSDPITPEELSDLGGNVVQHVSKLEKLIHSEQEVEAIECSKELLELLRERNRLCKLYK